ncbi:MAG: BatD family protein, partial [Oligoflexia bacterium]|nr:BatD family protein [Oligoflexia bacterium]
MKKIVLPVLIFFLTCPVFAKTTVEASVDSASATLEEGLTYTIQVKTDEQLTTETGMPDLSVLEKDFQIGSQYQSTSFASKYENGKFVFERSRYYRYKLFPLSEGKKTIPSFQVRAGGKVFKTDPITIEAVDSGGRQPRARNYQPPATAPQYRQYGQYGQQQDRQTAP